MVEVFFYFKKYRRKQNKFILLTWQQNKYIRTQNIILHLLISTVGSDNFSIL